MKNSILGKQKKLKKGQQQINTTVKMGRENDK